MWGLIVTLNDEFFDRLGELSRRAYVLAFAMSEIEKVSPASFGDDLQVRFERFCHDGRQMDPQAIQIQPEQVRQVRRELPSFIADLLLVSLESEFHGLLMRLFFPDKIDESSKPLEELFNCFAPRQEQGEHRWAYQDAILLAEIRNAIVHGQGVVKASHPRLLAAGWSSEILSNETCLDYRSFSDFLRFKRCVRTIATFAVKKNTKS